MISILRFGENNNFASNFRRMRYCGFWIVHDDIRRVGSEAIVNIRDQLVGTWTLLSWEQKKGDGTKRAAPKGIAFFDAGGRYVITVMRPDRAKYASNALWQG